MIGFFDSMVGAALGAAAMMVAGCGSRREPPASTPATAAIEVTDVAGADAAVGKRVRVTGTARNAKLSAVVVSGELLVYATAHDAWPGEVVGKQVAIEGLLEREQGQPASAPSGEVRATIEGPYFVIRAADYNVVP